MNVTRRHFVKSATAATLAFGAVPLLRAQSTRKFRTALIGSGWWGMNILREAMASGRSKVIALGDVDTRALDATAMHVNDASGDQPKKYRDFRELLDKEKPEIVIVATPDHWHSLISIAALRAGAHVFVEKPTGHTVRESRAMVDVAKATGRLVQVGLHRRIGPHFVSGMKFLKEGGAGQIGMVRAFVHSGGGKERPAPNADPPEGLDWDFYCGPAQLRPFNTKIHPGGWRNFLGFANGTLGDWGVHWLDQVLRWTDEKFPRRIFSTGGRPVQGEPVLNEREQTSDAPDSQIAVYQFESFTVNWEHRKFADNKAEKSAIGCNFYGTKGTFHLGWRDGWTFYPANDNDKILHEPSQIQEPDGHNLTLLWKNFLESIDAGRVPIGDVESAHRATNMSLLGMLSLKLGRSIQWDGDKETIPGDAEANQLLSRAYRGPWEYPKA
ncbi:MAG: Gfo/Idh/MocA family oxidoreductase [Verrucomicrobia bacterium]|nr:Gfo/Idh/MocA family oxidoreductase [Verrucomicrobiota bacterium]